MAGHRQSKTVRVEGLLRGVDTFVKEVELMPDRQVWASTQRNPDHGSVGSAPVGLCLSDRSVADAVF
jgi:hypothetical protein